MYEIIENYLTTDRIEDIDILYKSEIDIKIQNSKFVLVKIETDSIKDNLNIINLNLFFLNNNFKIQLIYNQFYKYKKNNSKSFNLINKKGKIDFNDEKIFEKINENTVLIFIDNWNKKNLFKKLKKNFNHYIIIKQTNLKSNFSLLNYEIVLLNKLINNLNLSKLKTKYNLQQIEILEMIKENFNIQFAFNKFYIENYRAEYINLLLLLFLNRQLKNIGSEIVNINYKMLSYKEKNLFIENFKFLDLEIFKILKSKEFYVKLLDYAIKRKNYYLIKVLEKKIKKLF